MTDKKDSIDYTDDDQVFGDNDKVARINIEERNKNIENLDEDTAERTRNVLNEAKKTRDKLNEKMNEVRDYGADARETPLQ